MASLTRSPCAICCIRPAELSVACRTPYPAVHATVTAATATRTGRPRSGERRAAAARADSVSPRRQVRSVARNPLRKMGASIHFQDAAASPIATAASIIHSQAESCPVPTIATAIAMTGQCHR